MSIYVTDIALLMFSYACHAVQLSNSQKLWLFHWAERVRFYVQCVIPSNRHVPGNWSFCALNEYHTDSFCVGLRKIFAHFAKMFARCFAISQIHNPEKTLNQQATWHFKYCMSLCTTCLTMGNPGATLRPKKFFWHCRSYRPWQGLCPILYMCLYKVTAHEWSSLWLWLA